MHYSQPGALHSELNSPDELLVTALGALLPHGYGRVACRNSLRRLSKTQSWVVLNEQSMPPAMSEAIVNLRDNQLCNAQLDAEQGFVSRQSRSFHANLA